MRLLVRVRVVLGHPMYWLTVTPYVYHVCPYRALLCIVREASPAVVLVMCTPYPAMDHRTVGARACALRL